MKKSQEAIDAIFQKQMPHNSLPELQVGDVPLCEKYYIAARGCQGKIEKSTPDNFMNISSIICGNLVPSKLRKIY